MAINLGLTAMSNAKLGTTQVDKIYLGSTQIWSHQAPVSLWGTLGYYSVFSEEYVVESQNMCTVNSIDAETLEAWLAQQEDFGMIDFQYMEGFWEYGDVQIAPEDMLSTTGIDVTLDDGADFAMFGLEKTIVADTTSPIITFALSQSGYDSLASSDSDAPIVDGGLTIPRAAVANFAFGTASTSVPDNFLSACINLVSVDFTNATSLTSIGNYFLSSCSSFNSPVNLPNTITSIGGAFLTSCMSFNQTLTLPSGITSIGDSFLLNCQRFNQPLSLPSGITSIGMSFLNYCEDFNRPLTLPSGLTTIGRGFISGCSSFNQSFALPSSITSIGTNFLHNSRAMTGTVNVGSIPTSVFSGGPDFWSFSTFGADSPAYVTGISVSGSAASSWKAGFPDRTSSPYRKLIVVS